MSNSKRRVTFSLPLKTFLVGEYSVLKEGAGILISTEPRFQVSLQRKSLTREAHWSGFSEGAPGRKFLHKYRDLFRDFNVEFVRPLGIEGGVGASSGEFVAAYLLASWLRSQDRHPVPEWEMRSLLKEYRELAWNEVGTPPSGADVVSQILGGVSYIYPHHFLHRELSWSCVDLGFLLLATGAKEATHTHLETLDHLDVEDLADCVELVAGALERSDSGNLISGINEYAEMLRFKNLVSRNTLDLISQAFRWPGVVAAKGCGALGADVILVVYEINKAFDLLYHVERSSMTVLSGHEQISEGWRFEGYRAVDKKYE